MRQKMSFRLIAIFFILGILSELAIGQSIGKAGEGDKLRLTLKTVSDFPSQKEQQTLFTIKEPIYLLIFGQNQGDKQIGIVQKRYEMHRLYHISLTKDGNLVEYSVDVKKALEDTRQKTFGGAIVVTLYPGEYKRIGVIYLQKWYDILDPGNYELTLHLDLGEQGKTEPESIHFTIVDK
jgi:hypothetical protein